MFEKLVILILLYFIYYNGDYGVNDETRFIINPCSNKNQLFCLGVYTYHNGLTCDLGDSVFINNELKKLKKEVKKLKQQLEESNTNENIKKIIVQKKDPEPKP